MSDYYYQMKFEIWLLGGRLCHGTVFL